MAKPKVIVFGASKAGENYLINQNDYDVLAIADNNVQKQGTSLHGITVIPPEHIHRYPYDYIIIASMFIHGITKQLTEDLSIHKDKIIYVPKRLLKIEDRETFRDPETKKLAYTYMGLLDRYFHHHQYKYFLNFGTLLGIVRDGDLIPWDDDIDLAIVKEADFKETEFLATLKEACNIADVQSEYVVKRKPQYGLVGLDVTVQAENTLPFTISIDLLIQEHDRYKLPIDVVPMAYFMEQEPVRLGELTLPAPSPAEQYLTHVYKDWKVVKRDVTYENNTTTYDEPEDLILQKEQ